MEDAIVQDSVSVYSPELSLREGQAAVYVRGELNIYWVKRVPVSNRLK